MFGWIVGEGDEVDKRSVGDGRRAKKSLGTDKGERPVVKLYGVD